MVYASQPVRTLCRIKMINNMTTIQTYGRHNNTSNIGLWGYKITFDDGTEKIDRGSSKGASADLMGLTAVWKSLQYCSLYSPVKLFVESEYVKVLLERIKREEKSVFKEKHHYTIMRIHSAIFSKILQLEINLIKY